MNVNPNDELYRSFVGKVAGRVNQPATWNMALGCYQLESNNWSAFAVKMHHYFFIIRDDAASAAEYDAYIRACVDWGLKNYHGLPRGLQKGVAIHPVLLQANPAAEVIARTKQKPDSHWAAFVLPSVVSLTSGTVEYLEQTPLWGFAMWKGIRKAAQQALG